MNILLINHYAGSPHHGMEFRPYYLAREWKKAGHYVRIVAASYSHIRTKQPADRLALRMDEKIDGIEYFWYRTPIYQGNGFGRVKSIFSFIWHLWRDAREMADSFKPDLVIASSTYPMDIWPAKRIAKLAGAQLVYEVHDLWPLSPMELGGMSRWHPFIMWVQMAEDYAYRHADKVISMLPKAKAYMQSRGMAPEKFAYVPNGINEQEWLTPQALPLEIAEKLDAMTRRGLPIVAYTGTHGLANALDVLLDAATQLKGIAQILLVGTGPDRERLLKRVEQEHLDNVVMLPAVQKHAIPTLLSRVDIAYIGLLPQSLFRFGISPNKLMDYMMAGKPIILSIKAGNDPVAEASCGITIPPANATAIVNAVQQLIALSPNQLKSLGDAGRQFILKNQTYPVLAQNFLRFVGIK